MKKRKIEALECQSPKPFFINPQNASTPKCSKTKGAQPWTHFEQDEFNLDDSFCNSDSLIRICDQIEEEHNDIISSNQFKHSEIKTSSQISDNDPKHSTFLQESNEIIFSTQINDSLQNVKTSATDFDNKHISDNDLKHLTLFQKNNEIFFSTQTNDSPQSVKASATDLVSILKETMNQNAKTPNSNRKATNVSISTQNSAMVSFAMEKAENRSEDDSFFGLPNSVKELFKQHRGIENLYEWQEQCLKSSAIKNGKNLVYSLPTSGGKTLVAEILILQQILLKKRNVILILPYISIVQEKFRALAPFAVDLDFIIEEYAGSKGLLPPKKRRHRHTLFIATIEKSHGLVNSLIEAKRLNELGLVVVDELHMLGDGGSRGAALESVLVKIKFISSQTQLIGMSATLGNMNQLKTFLQAEVYTGDYRPVELKEYIKMGNTLYNYRDGALIAVHELNYQASPESKKYDPDQICPLVMDVIPDHSCLVFCPTKKHCESVTKLLSQFIPSKLKSHKLKEKQALLKALSEEGSQSSILERSIMYGIAYHHSGLTMDERRLIEEAFSNGTLSCLACTSTLAAGVNLPARRVILRAPYIGINFLTLGRYKQMIGRAGRAGIDTAGESILMVQSSDMAKVLEFLDSPLDRCISSLAFGDGMMLKMLVLSLIGLGITQTKDQVAECINHTLLAAQNELSFIQLQVEDALNFLSQQFLVKENLSVEGISLEVTKLGKAIFKGNMDLSRAETIYKELKTHIRRMSFKSHLHLLYLVTPWTALDSFFIHNHIYYKMFMELSDDDKDVAECIGVPERCIVGLMSGHTISGINSVPHKFYVTLMLYELWKQVPLNEVADKFQVHRGTLTNFVSTATSYASCLSYFCKELDEFWALNELLPPFVKQFSFCSSMELIPLLELPSVKRGRAKQLYNSGFKTLTDVARAEPKELVKSVEHLSYRVAGQIVSAAKMLLFERAEALQEEVEELMAGFNKLL